LRFESDYKVTGGKLLRIRFESDGKNIKKILICGDFFIYPEDTIDEIESALIGCTINTTDLEKRINAAIEKAGAELIGVTPTDMTLAIIRALAAAPVG
jgi:lipoate-protein ligase A